MLRAFIAAVVLALLPAVARAAGEAAPPAAAAPFAPYGAGPPFRWDYKDEIAPVVTELIERSAALSDPVYAELGLAPVKGVVVHVARDHAAFLAMAPAGDAFPEWSEGITIPDRGEIFLTLLDARSGPVDVERVFAHEVSHVAVYVASGGRPTPRWFVEGYAILQSGEFSMEQVETMARLVARGGVSLRLMDRAFHGHAPSASAAYGAAADFVHFYRDECGRPALARVVAAVRDGADFYGAMGSACRPGAAAPETFEALEQRWVKGLSDRYPWWAMLRDDGALWAGAGLVLVLGFILVRRRRRAQLARMESQEQRFDAASDRAVAAAEERDRRAANAALLRKKGYRDVPDDPAPPGGWIH